MSDWHTKEQRSYNMSRIRSTDTKPEVKFRKALFGLGFRYSLNSKMLPGKPDIVLRKYRTVIFVNGCFWHGHQNCRYFVIPKTRTEFWTDKISKNSERDALNSAKLQEFGWNVITVWECELKKDRFHDTVYRIEKEIRQSLPLK